MRLGWTCLRISLVVCALLIPLRAEAAFITFSGVLDPTNEVQTLATLDLASSSLVTVTLSSGFDPLLSLFVLTDPSTRTFQTDSDQTDFFNAGALLDPGKYLLVLTQWPNYYEPKFDTFAVTDPNFFRVELGCDYSQEGTDECGNGEYSGTLNVQAAVPEPTTLSLVGLGACALWRRRRIQQRRHGNLRHRPSS